MALTSLQVCMDSTHWLEDSLHHDDSGMDSSSNSPSGDMLACPRPLIERRLRPQHDQPLKCPRCDSAHTKFCYYNNYSLSQPRYFCKTCRRYWTKGGTLRNIPVGGGCRKNKKVSSSKKTPDNHHNQMMNMPNPGSSSSSRSQTDLQLSFPQDMHFSSHINSLLANSSFCTNPSSFMEAKFGANAGPIDFMEGNKQLETLVGSSSRNNNNSNNYDFMGNNVVDQVQFGDLGIQGFGPSNFHGLCSPFGLNNSIVDGGPSFIIDQSYNHGAIDVKPNPKLLSLEWQDQSCSDITKNNGSYNAGYNNFNNLGSTWAVGMMNHDFGSSATNPLV